MPDHSISTEQLLAFAAGELDAAERTTIEQHLSDCRDCAETVERFHMVRAVLREGEPPPQSLIARVQAIHYMVRAVLEAADGEPPPPSLIAHAEVIHSIVRAVLEVADGEPPPQSLIAHARLIHYMIRGMLEAAEGEQPPHSLIARAQAIHRPLRDALTWPALLRRGVLAAALLMCMVLVSGGVRVLAANADDSLAGDTIYLVKLAGESIQLALTVDTTDQVKQHLALARTREQELAKLVALGRLDSVPATTRAAQDQMDQAIQGLLRLSRQDQAAAVALAPVVEQALEKHMQVLTGLLATAPPSARSGLEQAIRASQDAQSSIERTIPPGASSTAMAEAHPAEATSTLTQGGVPPAPMSTTALTPSPSATATRTPLGAPPVTNATVSPPPTRPPTASAGGPYSVPEGGSIVLSGSGADPDGDPITFAWDLTNSGSITTFGQNPTFSATALDGPSSRTVVLQVCDNKGACTTSSATVNITNVAPTMAINGAPVSSPEGTAIYLTSSVTDPSQADTQAGFSYAWSVTKNGSAYASGTSADFSFTPDDNGTYIVSLSATDKDGGTGTDGKTINVFDVPPTATLSNGGPVNEGSPVTIRFNNAFDPSPADVAAGFRYAFDCNNGSLAAATYANSIPSASTTCIYPDGPSTQIVRARIIDKDDGFTEYNTTVTVLNVAPTVGAISAPSNPVLVNAGSNFSASFTDPGVLDTHTGLWDWGDGTMSSGMVNETNGSGSVGGTHVYQSGGQYTVKLTVTDKDEAAGQSTYQYVVVVFPTTLSYTGPTASDYHDPVTLKAKLVDVNGAVVSGATLSFSLGSQSCTSTTDSSGVGSCALTLNVAAGSYTLNVSFGGIGSYLPSTAQSPFTVTREETSLTYTGPTLIAQGSSVQLSAVLKEDGVAPIAGRMLALRLGSQSCTGTTDGTGSARCALGPVTAALGNQNVTASFAGDANYLPASDTKPVLAFANPASGSFVLGDKTTTAALVSGATVTWWGAQWWKLNDLSGGSAPASFEGFANTLNTIPAQCGGSWTSNPGNSSGPPTSVPAYMAVIVSGAISKSGPNITGDILSIVIVKTKPGYANDPGNAGTGTIVATLCKK